MAKPTGWSIDGPARPNTGKLYQDNPNQASARRTRRRWRPSGRAPGPSPGVLSLLATIAAASSTADGSPLVVPFTPPSFLCPFIEHDGCHDISSDLNTASAVLSPRNERKPVQIADKFDKGADGKWHKADVYTLYGSTICVSNCPSASPSGGYNNAINPATPTPSTTPPASTVPQPEDKYAATMPTGWTKSDNYDKQRTTLILCVSLILAFLMCAFMTAFVIWRKKHRKANGGDEEMKLRRRKGQDVSEQEALMKKEARLKQKVWARASARWKANVQSLARRRKNRRLFTAAQSMSASLHDISRPESVRRAPSRSPSTCSSPAPTLRSSLSPNHGTTHVDNHVTLGPSISTPTTDPAPPSPPAYIQSDTPPSIQSKRNPSDETYRRTDHDPPPDPFSLVPHDIDDHPKYTLSTAEVPIPYDDSYHAGHVATDDKTLLARMATMASAPPVEPDEGGSSGLQTSAPIWDDEQHLEDIIDGLDDTEIRPSSHTSSSLPSLPSTSHSPFPAPPSKGKMAARDFYDYPYSFEEDVSSLEPEMGPSAPPFEEHTPSAPPLVNEPEMEPSAPPLMEEFLPSAPPAWKDGEGGQDHDREESPQQHSSQPLSPVSISDIVLPSYHA